MSRTFSAAGVRFTYPDAWGIIEERGPDELTISISDGQTANWSVTLMRQRPEPRHVLQEGVRAFREEYDDLDVEEVEEVLAHEEAIGANLDFECFELLNCAFLRAFQTERYTVLVMFQATDHEMDEMRPIFESINNSLRCEVDFLE